MQGICIQGSTTYFKELADNWSKWPNVVFSTWDDEDPKAIEYIRSKGINVLLNKKPLIPGYINVNYQVLSTFNGLKFLQDRGVTCALKIRGDHTISDVKSFLELLYPRKMAFIALSNINVRRDITYELGYIHEGHDYPSDNVIYGNINDMLAMFNFQTDRNYKVPPEALILYNYLVMNGYKVDFSFEYLQHLGISFFLRECLNKGIKINWLKKQQELTKLYNNEYYLF